MSKQNATLVRTPRQARRIARAHRYAIALHIWDQTLKALIGILHRVRWHMAHIAGTHRRQQWSRGWIAQVFAHEFADWHITLPARWPEIGGSILQGGWHIRYRSNQQDGQPYLDVYASHRMTNDRQMRLWADGRIEPLPALWHAFALSPADQARDDQLFEELQHKYAILMEFAPDRQAVEMSAAKVTRYSRLVNTPGFWSRQAGLFFQRVAALWDEET